MPSVRSNPTAEPRSRATAMINSLLGLTGLIGRIAASTTVTLPVIAASLSLTSSSISRSFNPMAS